MRSTWFIRAGRAAVALAFVTVAAGSVAAAAGPAPDRPRTRRALNLFAVTNAVVDVNRVFCGINNLGEICVDPTNSPVLGGGFWPKGTPDQYIFNSGLQIAGVIDRGAGFTWAGDTTGAYFFDARGSQVQGDAVTLVYNSLDPRDAAAWPNGAVVRDANLFDAALIGRNSVSQQDLWTRAWDGNPSLISGRRHPMGIMVEERGVAWNFPEGNQDIIYFFFTFYNVSARNPAVYNNPTIPAAVQAEIAAVGAQFQDRNEAAFNVQIPDNGYRIDSIWAAFSMDPDVGDAGVNYSTAILPFSMGVAYKADFLEPTWTFPPNIFGPPFVASPGFIGVKYLRSPVDPVSGDQVGLSMFSNTLNQATGFPDPTGVVQLWRYLSGKVSPAFGDNPCTFPGEQQTRRYCFLAQEFADTRFFQSSGPFSLEPGRAQTIVVAYVHAAPLPDVLPFVGGDMKPGIPPRGTSLAAGTETIRTLERAAGWVSHADGNSDGEITQDEVVTVPRSLLNKARVAQDVFDFKFLLPFSPEPPTFFVVPGDNQVTVVWQRSETETVRTGGGDPYFAVASRRYNVDPVSGDSTLNSLYDPNFRQYDVEGYRIYRGRTTGELELVAQFDYAGTTITDYTGAFAYTVDEDGDGLSECAPELNITDDCPEDFAAGATVVHDLVGTVIQIPAGGRVQLANGSVLILEADTAVTGGNSGFPALNDDGVPFVFVDRGVRNSFRYFYAVTAFDVNALKSGPSALESPRITKPVTPRRPGANATVASLLQGVFGADGDELNPGEPYPAIDSLTGTFNGIMPPVNGAEMIFEAVMAEALPPGDVLIRIDSVGAGFTGDIAVAGEPPVYLTISGGGNTIQQAIRFPQPTFSANLNSVADFRVDIPLVPFDSTRARMFGVRLTQDIRMPVRFTGSMVSIAQQSAGVSVSEGRFDVSRLDAADLYLSHSRWFDAGGQEPPDPTIRPTADSAHHAGKLTGVGRIWSPAPYRDPGVNLEFRRLSYGSAAWYPADFVITWNADSTITVRDSTHRSPLPFKATGGVGWGFVNIRALTAAGVTSTQIGDGTGTPNVGTAVSYHHFYGVRPACLPGGHGGICAPLEAKAQFQALDFNANGVRDADGIALLINSEPFIMEMNALPAAGTRWHLRAVSGNFSASCTPTFQNPTDCSGYRFIGPNVRPALVPGLTYRVALQSQYQVDSLAAGDLANVHTVPDPYYVTNPLEVTASTKVLKFVNLPNRAIIRIYSVSGVLVQVLTHNDAGGGGEATWNLRNRSNQFVASGVYFYHVEGPDGRTKVGRFTVVNFAQ